MSAAFLVAAAAVSWSVMHPTELDPAYMRRVAEKAAEYGGVDSFEVCGRCGFAWGGINALVDYAPYPQTAAAVDRGLVERTRSRMNEIVAIAHKAGKPVYYWHREGYMPKEMKRDLPELLDADGEYDLLGKAYLDYVRWKVAAAFDAVPGLDGIVLTLTEADFSVIHNSNPRRYPSDKVVDTITRIFLEEHEKRGKTFIFRSFGSVAKDYEDLLAGAALSAKDHRFEVETKVTAYDFDPFLPENPFLRRLPGCTLGAECDGLGEYLGAGYLPAAQVPVIRRYVDDANAKGTDRFTIRIDRVGNSLFDSAQEVNLYAYMRFVRDPSATPEQVLDEWAGRRWPKCREEMKRLSRMGFEVTTGTQFVKSHVSFHQNPTAPNFKYIKACGVMGVYRDGFDLHMERDMWGVLSDRKAPGRAAIRAEKERAVRLADEGLALLESIRDRLDPDEYARHRRAWFNATKATRSVKAFTDCACAYFDDMERGDADAKSLRAAIAAAERTIVPEMKNPNIDRSSFNMTRCVATGDDLDRVYFFPYLWLSREFLNEYKAEFAARAKLLARADVLDFVIPGGIYDDARTYRSAMHASYQSIDTGVPLRFVGNAIFPNGCVAVEFKDVLGARVEVDVDPSYAKSFEVTESVSGGVRRVTVSKKGDAYPALRSIALVGPGRRQ